MAVLFQAIFHSSTNVTYTGTRTHVRTQARTHTQTHIRTTHAHVHTHECTRAHTRMHTHTHTYHTHTRTTLTRTRAHAHPPAHTHHAQAPSPLPHAHMHARTHTHTHTTTVEPMITKGENATHCIFSSKNYESQSIQPISTIFVSNWREFKCALEKSTICYNSYQDSDTDLKISTGSEIFKIPTLFWENSYIFSFVMSMDSKKRDTFSRL